MADSEWKMPTEFIKRPEGMPQIDEKKVLEMRKRLDEHLTKWADRLQVSMAFTPQVIRQEGERWTQDGKTWELKNGIPQTVSALQGARMPWWCPRCSNVMNHRFDRKFYFLRGWCYNCNVAVEHRMRLDGTFRKWERQMVRANEVAFLKDKIQQHLDYVRTFTPPQMHFSDGRWEEAAPKEAFRDMLDGLLEDVDFMLKRLEFIQQEDASERQDEETVANDNSTAV